MNIPISDVFEIYNTVLAAKNTLSNVKEELLEKGGSMKTCVKCGRCEEVCPQGIKIRELLEKISKRLED